MITATHFGEPDERVRSWPAGFIPSRHGAKREQAQTLLGVLRLVIRPSEPGPDRWRKIGEALMHGDEPMDRLVSWMFSVGMDRARPQFEQALERGIESLSDAPQPLREFFDLVTRTPSWVDPRKLSEGAQINDRGGLDYFLVARDMALMGGYQASAFNKTLLLTGALARGPVWRVAETAQWFLDCTAERGMERFGIGFKSTLRVRLIHGLVRRHVQRLPSWQMETWGLPVNQIDMAGTALAFPMLMMLGGRALGIWPSRRDSEAAMHFGRYVGWLMGVEECWLPKTESEGHQLLYELLLSVANADHDSVQLAQALMNEPLQRPYKQLAWLRSRYERARHLSVSSFFLSRQAHRNLGLPLTGLPWYPLMRLPWNLLKHTAASVLPGGKAWLARSGRREVVAFLQSMTGHERQRLGHSARQLQGHAASQGAS
jgi:hypothetical protein